MIEEYLLDVEGGLEYIGRGNNMYYEADWNGNGADSKRLFTGGAPAAEQQIFTKVLQLGTGDRSNGDKSRQGQGQNVKINMTAIRMDRYY